MAFCLGDVGDSNVFVDACDELHFIDPGPGERADRRWISHSSTGTLRAEVLESATVAFQCNARAARRADEI